MKKGDKHAPETIEKIRIGNTGKLVSDESRLKMSIAHLGQKLSPEHAKAIAEGHRGMKYKVKGHGQKGA